MPFPVLELNGEMSRRWLACKTAFSRCKKLQDQATAFVSKCKTSTTGLKEQYKQLVVVSASIDKVVGKINDVLEQSVAASKVEGRASILIATCPVFTGHVNAFTALVQVIQGTRQGRSLSDLLDLVDQIIYVTIYPACSVDEISDLNSVKEVVSVIQAAVAQQIQQIQSIISHVQEDTLAPEDVGISQVKIPKKQLWVLRP